MLRRGVFVTVLAGALLTVASNASAEVVGLCGVRNPEGQVRTAKLALDEDTTEEEVVISSSSEPKLVLRFKVDVCNVGPAVAQRINVLATTTDLKDEVFGEPIRQGLNTVLVVTIPLVSSEIPRGEHEVVVTVGGGTPIAEAVNVHMTILKNAGKGWAVGTAMLGWLAGLGLALLGPSSSSRAEKIIGAFIGGLPTLFVVATQQYSHAKSWTADPFELAALLLAGATAAYSGAFAVIAVRDLASRDGKNADLATPS